MAKAAATRKKRSPKTKNLSAKAAATRKKRSPKTKNLSPEERNKLLQLKADFRNITRQIAECRTDELETRFDNELQWTLLFRKSISLGGIASSDDMRMLRHLWPRTIHALASDVNGLLTTDKRENDDGTVLDYLAEELPILAVAAAKSVGASGVSISHDYLEDIEDFAQWQAEDDSVWQQLIALALVAEEDTSPSKRRRPTKEKIRRNKDIIRKVERGTARVVVARDIGVSASTITAVMNDRDRWMAY